MIGLAVLGALASLPNIVYILTDDVGYGDLSCYGATKVKTPNIDLLARTGTRFTDAHSPSTVCTPTRYSLLTGEYAYRRPQASNVLSGQAPLSIAKGKATLPAMLQHAGYRTGIVGKWHLGLGDGKPNWNGELKPGPNSIGFDYSFIIPATGDRVPCVFVEDQRVVGLDPSDPIQVNYQTKVGNEPTGAERPDLLKIRPVVGHSNTIVNGVSRIGFMAGGMKARWVDEDIADTITGKALAFIEKSKSGPFFLYFATHDVHAPQLPNKRFEGQNDCGLRGFTLAELDWSVGQILAALKKNGLAGNTIVVFTSDNGAVDSDGYEDKRENLNGHQVNGVLRGTKYTLWEGGHRVPMLAAWPGHAPAGRTSEALVCQTDMYASFAHLIGHTLTPSEAPDSYDVSGALFAGGKGRETLVHHLGGAASPLAYRSGDYVLVPEGSEWRLFNLRSDLAQKNDISSSHQDMVARLRAELERARLNPTREP